MHGVIYGHIKIREMRSMSYQISVIFNSKWSWLEPESTCAARLASNFRKICIHFHYYEVWRIWRGLTVDVTVNCGGVFTFVLGFVYACSLVTIPTCCTHWCILQQKTALFFRVTMQFGAFLTMPTMEESAEFSLSVTSVCTLRICFRKSLLVIKKKTSFPLIICNFFLLLYLTHLMALL